VADEGWALSLGRALAAWGGIVEQYHGHSPRQPFRQDHLLLISAGERAGPQAGLARTNIDELHQLRDDAVAGITVEITHARERIEIGKQDVVPDRLIHDEAKGALARHHADAGGDGVARTGEAALLAGDLDPRRLVPGAEQAAHHPIRAAAEQAGQSDHPVRA